MVALNTWVWEFFQSTVVQSGLLDPSYQFGTPPTFDPNNLPDPTDTSISRAQQTANEAYNLARSLVP